MQELLSRCNKKSIRFVEWFDCQTGFPNDKLTTPIGEIPLYRKGFLSMDNKSIRVPLYTEREEVINFDMYIYGTKDAEEQKHDFFGKALKRYADDIGVSATELANLTGISKSAVNYYFSGER